jgi:hypothetical protein
LANLGHPSIPSEAAMTQTPQGRLNGRIRLCNKIVALYQGTTLVVPQKGQNGQGFSPCASFVWSFRADCGEAEAKARTFWPGDGTTEVVP